MEGYGHWADQKQNPFWPFNSFTKTEIYHVGSGDKLTAKGTHKGYTIYQDNKSGSFVVPALEKESRFDTKKDATRFVDQWAKTAKNPRKPKVETFWHATNTESQSKKDAEEMATRIAAMGATDVSVVKKRHQYKDFYGRTESGSPEFAHKGWRYGTKYRPINGQAQNPRGDSSGPVYLTSNEDGTQLFIVGGDQSLDLSGLGITGQSANKELITIGSVTNICYHAHKIFDGKREEFDYVHKFSEDSHGPLPVLIYDRINRQLKLSGGVYKIERPLVGTSPGIED